MTTTKGFRVETLELQGFGSYKNKTIIDFSQFKEVAIIGHNGSGKSTLLEAILFALYGQTRQRTLDLAIGLGANQAKVTLTFFLGEDKYRLSRIRSKNRSILTLEQEVEYGYKDMTLATIADTQQVIDEIVGVSFSSMVSTAFMRQGEADRFASATPAEKKDILIEILELDFFENIAINSRKKESEIVTAISGLESKMEVYRDTAATLDEKEDALDEINNALSQDQMRLDDINISIEDAKTNIERVKQRESVIRSIKVTKNQIEQIDRSNEEALVKHKNSINNAEVNLEGKILELDRYSHLSDELVDASPLVETKKDKSTLLKSKRDDRASLADLVRGAKALLEERSRRARELARAEEALARANEMKPASSLADLEAEIENITVLVEGNEVLIRHGKAELPRLMKINKELDATYEKLSNRKWEVDNAKCSACGQPLHIDQDEKLLIDSGLEEAKAALDVNTKDIDDIEASLARAEEEVSAHRRELAEINGLLLEATKFESNLESLKRDVSNSKKALSEIESSDIKDVDEVSELEIALGDLGVEIESLEDEITNLDFEILAIYETNREIEEKKSLNKEISFLQAELKKLRDSEPQQVSTSELAVELDRLSELLEGLVVDDQTIDLESLEREHRNYAARVKANQAEAARIGKEIEIAKSSLAELKRLEEEKKSLEETLFVYKFISSSASKTGIQSYLLSIILPELEAVVNSYLERMTQGQISISFITEREGKGKDGAISTLEIIANTPSGERPYSTFSGAERFIMDISMRMALARLLATRNGRTLRFFVIDEGWGSLDEEHTKSLLEILRSISDDFDLIMTVTHVEKVAEAFPVRFVVQKNLYTGSSVEAHF